jgi:hypothetical protein
MCKAKPRDKRSQVSALFLSSDLMFGSRLLGAAQALGVPLMVAARPEALGGKLTGDCKLVLVDLSLDGLELPAAVAAIRAAAPAARIVAFGAHVNELALAAAEAAGCDLVLARGQFHKQYAELLRGAL